MSKYRKKPVTVDAEQFFVNKKPWPEGVKSANCHEFKKIFVVTIHKQDTYIEDGDWIIAEHDGIHFYPCKPDIFERDYEQIKDTALTYCDGSVHCASKEETHEVQVRKDINCDKAEIEQEQFAKWAEHQFWNEDSSNTPASEEKTYV